jgi:hypothetical protein
VRRPTFNDGAQPRARAHQTGQSVRGKAEIWQSCLVGRLDRSGSATAVALCR